MIKRFYSAVGQLIFLNAIVKPVWIFGIDREVQNLVGTDIYGVYFSLLNLSIVLSFLLDWGFTGYFNRQLAATSNVFLKKAGIFLLLKLAFTALYLVIVFSVAWLSGITEWRLLTGVVLVQVFTSLFLFFRSIITASQLFQTDAWLSVLDKILMILLCGSMIYYPESFIPVSISNFLYLQVACTAMATISAALVTLRNGISYKVNKSFFSVHLFRQAFPYALIILLMSAHYRLDGFLLERIHDQGSYQAGIYAAAYRLLDASNMVGYLVASFLMPFIARNLESKELVRPVVANSRNFLLLFSLIVIGLTWLFGPQLNELLYHRSDYESTLVLQLTLPALFGYSLVQVYGTVLTATGRVLDFCIVILFALVLNLILNLILIPMHGATGAAIAAIASHLLAGSVTMAHAKRNYLYLG
jgi:O-antigen/teichoic acid export membrane protein